MADKYMYSAARVNQFESKDACFEFVINVSRQGNNVDIELNLKINLKRLQSSFFYEINESTPEKQPVTLFKKIL